jgi:hypothetical protein
MSISPQSIRKGTTITFDGVVVDKHQIIDASQSWDDNQQILFKKMLKQGGKFRINGIVIDTKPTEILLTSRGEKDIKPIIAPGCNDRF